MTWGYLTTLKTCFVTQRLPSDGNADSEISIGQRSRFRPFRKEAERCAVVSIHHHSCGLCSDVLHRDYCVVFVGGHLWRPDLESVELAFLLLSESQHWEDGERTC